MNLIIARSTIQHLISRRNSFLTLSVGLLLSNLMLIVCLVKSFHSEKIILVPPNIERPMWITNKEVSPEYLSGMSIFLTSLLMNITASNAALQHNLFLRFVDSQNYQTIKTNLLLEEEKLKKDHMAIHFHLSGIKVDSEELIAHISGDLQYQVGEAVLPIKHASFVLKFTYDSGFLRINTIEELKL